MQYNEVITYIENIPKFASKNTLDNTAYFLASLGNPQDSYKIIHVAGTNGKGSTCSYLNAMLLGMGKKVGMFTSPHLIHMTERIRINDVDIKVNEFLEIFHIVQEKAISLEKEGVPHPSFFEFLMIMAFVAFERSKVEYVVLETGLGGLLDSTNVIKKPVATIITSIGLDHEQYLGNSIEEVAMQKSGIIKSECPVIFDDENQISSKLIQQVAGNLKSDCRKISDYAYEIIEKTSKYIAFSFSDRYDIDTRWEIPNKGNYQVRNAILAIITMMVLFGEEELEVWKQSLAQVYWAGRMDQVLPNIYVDGAHNIPAIKTLVEEVKQVEYLLYAAVEDKKYEDIIKLIVSHIKVDKIIVTNISNPRGVSVDDLENTFIKFGQEEVITCQTVSESMEYLMKNKKEDEKALCIGSLYLVGEIIETVNNYRG